MLVHWDMFEKEDDQTTSCEGLDVLWATLMKRKKWHVPFSLGGLMIMAMLSVRGKHSSYVAGRLPGIPEMHNVPQRWFSICARRTDYSWESIWKVSSSFVLEGGRYGSCILNRNVTEPSSTKTPGLLCFYAPSHTVWDYFPQDLKWLKLLFMYKKRFSRSYPGFPGFASSNKQRRGCTILVCFEVFAWVSACLDQLV